MTKPTVDELLRSSAPSDVYDEPGMRERVALAVAQRPTKKLRRAWIVLPVAAFGVAALTAGAIVVDNVITTDVTIPLSYVTAEGNTYTCDVNVGGATLLDPKGVAIANWYRDQDWSGFGQKVYEKAITLDSTDLGLDDGTEYSQADIDSVAWGTTLGEMIGQVPASVGGDTFSTGAQWDCDGLLH
jgi:hypothetical protein